MAGRSDHGALAAAGAEAVQPLPVLQGDGVDQQTGVARGQQQSGLAQPGGARRLVHPAGERVLLEREVAHSVVVRTEEVPVGLGHRRLEGGRHDEFGTAVGGVVDQRLAAGDDEDAGGGVAPGRRQPGLVETVVRGAVDSAGRGEADRPGCDVVVVVRGGAH